MKRISAVFLCFFVFFSMHSAYAAEQHLYKTSYVCKDLKGRPRWKATYEIKHKQGDIYTLIEKGKGLYYGFKGRISWVDETEIEGVNGSVRPLKMEKRIFNESGELIVLQKQEFNFDKNVVICTDEDLIKKTFTRKKFKFSKEIINRVIMGLYVQKFLEKGDTKREIQVVSPEPAFYTIELRIEDTEEINVNGRKMKAYKLCMDPKLGIFNFIKVFLPKAYTWHSAEPIYEWLRYEGVENSVNSPEVIITTLD